MNERITRIPDDLLGGLPKLTDVQIGEREAQNGLLQFDRMKSMIEEAAKSGLFSLDPESIKQLQQLAVDGLEASAGAYRSAPVYIGGSTHEPPPHADVERLVLEMCDRVNREPDPIRAASYVMWRLNWIHPFSNGNGRTSRVTSYLVLCGKIKSWLPGKRTVPDLIVEHRRAYYAALDAADEAFRNGIEDLSAMQELLHGMLIKQLSE